MDDFRDASYSEPYIYVLDPTTGKTKTVIDRFYSFVWTERFAEAGEFELEGPEQELWTSLIQEGDLLQFSHSDILKGYNLVTKQRDGGEEGRYTMIVEQRYTEWDSETGYTVVAKGRSLECILDRRINLGVGKESIQYTLEGTLVPGYGLPDSITGGYGLGLMIHDGPQWPPKRFDEYANSAPAGYWSDGFDTGDTRWDQSASHKLNNLIPETFLAGGREYGRTYEYVLLQAILYNCGDQAIKNRQFENFEVDYTIPMRNDDGTIAWLRDNGDGQFDKHGHQAVEVYDGKMQNLYDIVKDLLAKCEDDKGGVGYRIVGGTSQSAPFSTDTVFKMKFTLYMGEDLTIDGPFKNRGDKVVVFSRDWDNLESMNYIHGIDKYKNVCYQDTGLECEPEDLWSIRMQLEGLDNETRDLDNKESDIQKEEDAIDNPSDAQKKSFESRREEIKKRREEIRNEQERLERFRDDAQKTYDRMGHRSFYYGVYPRIPENDPMQNIVYPKGLARKECYNNETIQLIAGEDFEYLGRARNDFQKWEQYEEKVRKKDAKEGDESDNAYNTYRYWRSQHIHADWLEFSGRVRAAAFTFLRKDDNSMDDDVEATVNYNAIYQPVKDYRVGDIVSVMGIHNNETVRKMRCDEMVYTIDPGGFTVVPTFSILPLKDDAQ